MKLYGPISSVPSFCTYCYQIHRLEVSKQIQEMMQLFPFRICGRTDLYPFWFPHFPTNEFPSFETVFFFTYLDFLRSPKRSFLQRLFKRSS